MASELNIYSKAFIVIYQNTIHTSISEQKEEKKHLTKQNETSSHMFIFRRLYHGSPGRPSVSAHPTPAIRNGGLCGERLGKEMGEDGERFASQNPRLTMTPEMLDSPCFIQKKGNGGPSQRATDPAPSKTTTFHLASLRLQKDMDAPMCSAMRFSHTYVLWFKGFERVGREWIVCLSESR